MRNYIQQLDLSDPIRAERELRRILNQIYDQLEALGGAAPSQGSSVTLASGSGGQISRPSSQTHQVSQTSQPMSKTSPGSASFARSSNLQGPSPSPSSLSRSDLNAVQAALQYGGVAELNVDRLRGDLLKPQRGRVAVYETALPPVAQPGLVDGELASLGDDLFLYRQGNPGVWVPLVGAGAASGTFTSGTYAARPAASPNALYYATDRKVLYYADSWLVWHYLTGIHQDTIANKPVLTAADIGYQFFNTTYGHQHNWTGSVWEWGFGDPGSGWFMFAAITPENATTWWSACMGGSIDRCLKDMTTTTTPLPNCWTYPMFPLFTGMYNSGIDEGHPVHVDSEYAGVVNSGYPLPIDVTDGASVAETALPNTPTTGGPSLGVQVQAGSTAWVPHVNHTHDHYHSHTHYHTHQFPHYHPGGLHKHEVVLGFSDLDYPFRNFRGLLWFRR